MYVVGHKPKGSLAERLWFPAEQLWGDPHLFALPIKNAFQLCPHNYRTSSLFHFSEQHDPLSRNYSYVAIEKLIMKDLRFANFVI